MTPWEMRNHLVRRLLDDADPRDPHLAAANAQVERLLPRPGTGCGRRYGDSGEGKAEYCAALERFIAAACRNRWRIRVNAGNGTRWIDGVLARVAKMAVRRP